jgi:hypothetical protein
MAMSALTLAALIKEIGFGDIDIAGGMVASAMAKTAANDSVDDGIVER